MNQIVDLYFSDKKIDNLDALDSQRSSKSLLATDISITLKLHLLLDYLKDCLQSFEHSEGLGLQSEQGFF